MNCQANTAVSSGCSPTSRRRRPPASAYLIAEYATEIGRVHQRTDAIWCIARTGGPVLPKRGNQVPEHGQGQQRPDEQQNGYEGLDGRTWHR